MLSRQAYSRVFYVYGEALRVCVYRPALHLLWFDVNLFGAEATTTDRVYFA